MTLRKFFFIILITLSMELLAQETGSFFLYIPDNEAMSDYLNMQSYLKDWDKNEINVDEENLSALFNNYIGKETLESLLFESFLRYTKNKNIQNRVLTYIKKNKLKTNFTESLKKLYAAVPIVKQADGKDVTQYSFNNSEFDENINLFLFDEVGFFNNEIGMLLFDNDWGIMTLKNIKDNSDAGKDSFVLIYGGGTNSMTISFDKYSNIDEKNIESKIKTDYYKKYNDNWKITTLPLEGILSRAGADKFIIVYGVGNDNYFKEIEEASFSSYLYNKRNKVLYEIRFFMNFSSANISFLERGRIFNLLFFQTLFIFLN